MPANQTDNELVLLDQILAEASRLAPARLDESQKFGYFAVDQSLKDYILSSDEILGGLTDGGGDGGVDGFYTFADESLVDEDFDGSRLPQGYALDLYIFQDKRERTFREAAFDRLTASLPVLLNLNAPIDPAIYSPLVTQRAEIFRALLRRTARKFPVIRIHVLYSAKAPVPATTQRLWSKARDLEALVNEIVGAESSTQVQLQGKRELLALARREPSRTLELTFESNASKSGQNSYVGLIPIKEFAEFLSDSSGNLKKFIFESNVRDFQGKNTQVNREIRESLAASLTASNPDFWWLNNGITILSSQVTIAGGKFIIRDPQIVNGLQTSVSIHEHFKDAPADAEDDRLLLVKIIQSEDEEVRNAVIIASNSQTNLLPSAIRAADDMQRDIEQHFVANGFYYDRRKNMYKNMGKPADLIFAVPYLAQAVLSIGFSEPDQARARPSSLIKRDADYQRIFSHSTPMDGYLWMAKLQREVDKRIKQLSMNREFKVNMRFHLSMLVGHKLLNGATSSPDDLAGLFNDDPNLDTMLPALAQELNTQLAEFVSGSVGMTLDRAAKSAEFVQYLTTNEAGLRH